MNSTWNVLSAAAVLLLTAGCAVDPFGLETERRTITVQPVRNPIVIDGEVSSGEWGHAEFHSLTDADPIPEELPPEVLAFRIVTWSSSPWRIRRCISAPATRWNFF